MFYDRYVQLCEQKKVKPSRAAEDAGVSKSAVTNWKKNGAEPTGENVKKLCAYFEVTRSELFGEQNEKPAAKSDGLTSKDKRDIARDLEKIMAEIESTETVMFDGDPATDAAKETLRNAIAMGLEYAKKLNKETYTPKKYRKEE